MKKYLTKNKGLILVLTATVITLISLISINPAAIKHDTSKIAVKPSPVEDRNKIIGDDEKRPNQHNTGTSETAQKQPPVKKEDISEKLITVDDNSITNILLLGVDNTEGNSTSYSGNRADTIMIATIDKKHQKIKLTSIMRDLWVPIYGYDMYSKINTAYALGGPKCMMRTINNNLGINIKYYVVVNFEAFQKMIDLIGGIHIDVRDYEIKEINKYINEVNGPHSTYIVKPGLQKLNGQQALSYSRIRKVGNADYERTERQRRVVSQMYHELKNFDIFMLPGLYDAVFSNIKTNIPAAKLLELCISSYKFSNTSIDSIRIPSGSYFWEDIESDTSVLKADLDKAKLILNSFIYGK